MHFGALMSVEGIKIWFVIKIPENFLSNEHRKT